MDLPVVLAAFQRMSVVDLSQTLEEHMPNFPTHSKFYHELWGSYWHGDPTLTYQLIMNEHNGTHVDAPAHYIGDAKPEGHTTIDEVPPGRLMGRGIRLDCRNFKEGGYVSRDFIATWETQHQRIERGDIVVFNFGWSEHWGLRPQNRRYLADWPGIGMDAAKYLIAKPIAAMGVDTLSPDPPVALASNPIHPAVLEKQILIIENLAHLDQLPDAFLFLALPLKIRGGSGSPLRALALVEGR